MNSTKIKILLVIFFAIPIFSMPKANAWGWYAHRMINRMAVFTLPPEMIGFFKKHIEYMSEHGVDPDKRCHGVEGEAQRHYSDIDHYGYNPFDSVPKLWKDAIAKYTEDTLQANGILPWWIEEMSWKLTRAFQDENFDMILWYAANYGHYIADAAVPLHNSEHYNGRTQAQYGVHAFWESRIPELYCADYDYFVGRAKYIDNIQDYAWVLVEESYWEIDSIYIIVDKLANTLPDDKKYVFEQRGAMMIKQFSQDYTYEFDKMSNKMVYRKLKVAIMAVGSIWYTCWVNAGQPDLSRLENREISQQHKKDLEETDKLWKTGNVGGRQNPIESEN